MTDKIIDENAPICATCRYFCEEKRVSTDVGARIGECRYFAPRPNTADMLDLSTVYAAWPRVNEYHWCGYHEFAE